MVPNQLWVADITYIAIETGFVYLAVILDAWSRRVVGYAISRSIDARLAIAALKSAIHDRNPPKGCIHPRIAVRNMRRPITDSSSPHMASLAP
jgi:putative transposase